MIDRSLVDLLYVNVPPLTPLVELNGLHAAGRGALIFGTGWFCVIFPCTVPLLFETVVPAVTLPVTRLSFVRVTPPAVERTFP